MKKTIIILFFGLLAVCISACQKTEQLQVQSDSKVPETTDDKKGMTFSHGDWIAERENVAIAGKVYRYIKYRIKPAKEIVIDRIATDEDELIIPKEIQGYPVKALGTLELEETREPVTLKGQNKLSKIIVPEGVEIIGESAFEKVDAEELMLPESLNKIGDRAFWRSKITYVKLESQKTSFGYEAFAESNLKTIDLQSDFSGYFGLLCFQGTDLETIRWPKFNENYGLRMENNVQVESGVFKNCKKLKKVIFPKEQQFIKIQCGTFNGCSKLKKLVFPAEIKKVVYGSHLYADNNKAGGPDKLVFLGIDTDWVGIPCHYNEKLSSKEVLTTHIIQAPKKSKAIMRAKKALRVCWLSRSTIKYENEHGVTQNITGLGEGSVKLAPLEYEYLK